MNHVYQKRNFWIVADKTRVSLEIVTIKVYQPLKYAEVQNGIKRYSQSQQTAYIFDNEKSFIACFTTILGCNSLVDGTIWMIGKNLVLGSH